MSLAKAVFSGIVYRDPQLRSTQNNVPIAYATFDIGSKEEELIRIISIGNSAEAFANSIKKGDRLVVEGSLEMTTTKSETGEEKRVVDLRLSSFEKITGSSTTATSSSSQTEDIVKFSPSSSEELIGEDEIPF